LKPALALTLAKLFNPSTFRHMSECGLSASWKVWEVGAGGPSIPAWLVDRVGPTGRVLATDIDTTWLDRVKDAKFEVISHDVAAQGPPARPSIPLGRERGIYNPTPHSPEVSVRGQSPSPLLGSQTRSNKDDPKNL
jgi:hypothetical protein